MSFILDEQQEPASPTPDAKTFILDVGTSNFVAEIIDASRERLVLVDFWAPWCGPCKQLGPLLEKTVSALNGAVRLAKVNIDENPQIASQMRVQSIPAVFAFFQGQPIDGFMGALPESQLKSWVDRLVKATGSLPPGEHDGFLVEEALRHADESLLEGDIETAQTIYADLLKQDPKEARAFSGSLRCLVAEGKAETAAEILSQAMPELRNHTATNSARAAIDVALQAQKTLGQLTPLIEKVLATPDDLSARYDLALAYYASGENEKAVDELLEIVHRNRGWNDEAARKQLVKLFEIFGPTHALTISARKRLSSILFS